MLGKLYSNSLLVLLNARVHLPQPDCHSFQLNKTSFDVAHPIPLFRTDSLHRAEIRIQQETWVDATSGVDELTSDERVRPLLVSRGFESNLRGHRIDTARRNHVASTRHKVLVRDYVFKDGQYLSTAITLRGHLNPRIIALRRTGIYVFRAMILILSA